MIELSVNPGGNITIQRRVFTREGPFSVQDIKVHDREGVLVFVLKVFTSGSEQPVIDFLPDDEVASV